MFTIKRYNNVVGFNITFLQLITNVMVRLKRCWGWSGGAMVLGKLPVLGWSGGAMVLGKLPVPGRPTILIRARAYCACSRCGWGVFCTFLLSSILSLLSPSLWVTARYRLNYCFKGPLNPKQPTNQLNFQCRGVLQF